MGRGAVGAGGHAGGLRCRPLAGDNDAASTSVQCAADRSRHAHWSGLSPDWGEAAASGRPSYGHVKVKSQKGAVVGAVIGALLPVALGVAISPVPIISVVILMLFAPHAKAASLAFLVGWVGGITLVVVVVTLVVDPVDDSEAGDPSTFVSVLQLVIGAAAVLLAVQQWRSRPRAGQEPVLPKWMSAISTITAPKALGLGALLSGSTRTLLVPSGGLTIGSGALSGPARPRWRWPCSSSSDRARSPSPVARAIRSPSNACRLRRRAAAKRRRTAPTRAMAVLLLVIGVVIIGKGLAGLEPEIAALAPGSGDGADDPEVSTCTSRSAAVVSGPGWSETCARP